ncbi:MAG: hypothetical protein KAI95_17750, partial [Bacteroidales bacterium]|nr:hypothetical protein [Bacteroidales bacterium]
MSAILVLLSGLIILLPDARQSSGELNVPGMLEVMNESGQFLTVDQVARMVVYEDTSILLVDVRDTEAYRAVHIPGAINIPV